MAIPEALRLDVLGLEERIAAYQHDAKSILQEVEKTWEDIRAQRTMIREIERLPYGHYATGPLRAKVEDMANKIDEYQAELQKIGREQDRIEKDIDRKVHDYLYHNDYHFFTLYQNSVYLAVESLAWESSAEKINRALAVVRESLGDGSFGGQFHVSVVDDLRVLRGIDMANGLISQLIMRFGYDIEDEHIPPPIVIPVGPAMNEYRKMALDEILYRKEMMMEMAGDLKEEYSAVQSKVEMCINNARQAVRRHGPYR